MVLTTMYHPFLDRLRSAKRYASDAIAQPQNCMFDRPNGGIADAGPTYSTPILVNFTERLRWRHVWRQSGRSFFRGVAA